MARNGFSSCVRKLTQDPYMYRTRCSLIWTLSPQVVSICSLPSFQELTANFKGGLVGPA